MSGTESHESAPAYDPLRAFLSGKRRSERQVCSIPVEVRGGGAAVPGVAIDLSEGGSMIRIELSALNVMKPDMGPLEVLETLERYFKHGMQLLFLKEGIRVPGTLVRMSPPTMPEEGVRIGCRFERELANDEAARLLRAPPAAPLVPLRLAPKDGEGLYVYLAAPADAQVAGPLHLARVTGLDVALLDARVEPSRPMSMDDIGAGLSQQGLMGRVVANGKTLWEGSLRLQALRPALSMNPAVDARFSAPMPFGRGVEKHFRRRV